VALVTGTIGLTVKERKPLEDKNRYRERNIKQWCDDLPMANIGELAKRLYGCIHGSNEVELEVPMRMHLLKSLEPLLYFVTDALKKHYLGQSASLNSKQRKIANLCQTLQQEQAIGYKTIIEDLYSADDYTSKYLPDAVCLALHYLHEIQIRSYQLYTDLKQGHWREMHLLYQLAEQNQFHQNKTNVKDIQISSLNIYKKILLIATTNPNQIRQRDIENTAQALINMTQYTSITAEPDAQYDFVSNLNSDAQPFHRSLVKDGMKAFYRGISVVSLVQYLQQELKTAEQNKRTIKLSDTLLRHLLRSWGSMATRSFSRTKGNGSIKVSIGLGASHYLIHKELFGEDDSLYSAPETNDTITDLEGSLKNAVVLDNESGTLLGNHSGSSKPKIESGGDQIWNAMYLKKAAQPTEVDSKQSFTQMTQATNAEQHKYEFNEAFINNISPGGYCLELKGTLPKQTQTGEIIGLLETDEDDNLTWNIGNIRWLKNEADGEALKLGVQLIAPNARPVLAQVRTSKSDDSSYQRSLLLPALPGLAQPESILTSPVPFALGQKVRLKNDDESFDVKLTKLLSSGISYKQFAYEKLVVMTETEQKKPDESEGDLDNVWDLL
jgi:cyclic-di-GMP-binding protein